MSEFWLPIVALIGCFILGGLPLTGWITRSFTGQDLKQLGTGNVSVSAAFYHGGQAAGILAVFAEAFKGIAAVLVFRILIPGEPVWEIIGLIALVLGRFAIGRGAGTTNVVWGYLIHDIETAFFVAVIGGIGFTVLREKQIGRLSVLALLPIITALSHPNAGGRIVAVMVLSSLIAIIYRLIPDDLDLSTHHAHPEAKPVFSFFRGDRAIQTLNQRLSPKTAGQKAARLAELKRLGYPVPKGWVLPPGDDPQPLVDLLAPSQSHPLIVRSSATDEDSELSSAAGQYDSILDVMDRLALRQAIAQCQLSYSKSSAVQYRRDRSSITAGVSASEQGGASKPVTSGQAHRGEGGMAVLVQPQIRGVFSGVAFSRDPVSRQGEAVVIEALPGTAAQVVSGRKTPEYYRVWIPKVAMDNLTTTARSLSWQIPEGVALNVEGTGDVPPSIIKQVAYLVRHIEHRLGDIPQDMEWSYDGKKLWILQSRPITTMLPVWTRKIAAEVIPGFIRPLTWSINRPLTCGVWGDIFKIVLGDRARGLDFSDTATLHHSSAYFNATLLGDIFQRMGLPPESLEFLTRGAKFSRPPILSTLRNVPGLLRLLHREWDLLNAFADDEPRLRNELARLVQKEKAELTATELLADIHLILDLLKDITYYNILAPLSTSLRKTVLKVPDDALDTSVLPEVAALRSLKQLAAYSRPLIPGVETVANHRSTLFVTLAENQDSQTVLTQLDQFLDTYGYLSDVATDIAVPTWKDDPRPVYDLFTKLLKQSDPSPQDSPDSPAQQSWSTRHVQRRLDLKGTVAELYNRMLAELRSYFLTLEQKWLNAHILEHEDDIFFLTFEEIQHYVDVLGDRPQPNAETSNLESFTSESTHTASEKQRPDQTARTSANDVDLSKTIQALVQVRKERWETDAQVTSVPFLVYGQEPPLLSETDAALMTATTSGTQLQGIGASSGQVKGTVVIVRSLQTLPDLSKEMILVVPYADSGWAPLLAQAGGLIAEVGGRLSHGAIIAREYGIPAIMDVQNAIALLREGQTVIMNGETGIITLV
ncbi:MAG: glycerol-3-phosphate acyltransferase [Leptolyngbyaceae bacterium]|nr:glycerol-3-phosphate acyltransferase [Leptolyngbyaceae bacterium]